MGLKECVKACEWLEHKIIWAGSRPSSLRARSRPWLPSMILSCINGVSACVHTSLSALPYAGLSVVRGGCLLLIPWAVPAPVFGRPQQPGPDLQVSMASCTTRLWIVWYRKPLRWF